MASFFRKTTGILVGLRVKQWIKLPDIDENDVEREIVITGFRSNENALKDSRVSSKRFLNTLGIGVNMPIMQDYRKLIHEKVTSFGLAVMRYYVLMRQESGAACAAVSEWLRSWTRNPMGFARTGSNPVRSVFFFTFGFLYLYLLYTEIRNNVYTYILCCLKQYLTF